MTPLDASKSKQASEKEILYLIEHFRDMAAHNLRLTRRWDQSSACHETEQYYDTIADWYEGRYGAYKMASEQLSASLEYLQNIGAVFKSEDHESKKDLEAEMLYLIGRFRDTAAHNLRLTRRWDRSSACHETEQYYATIANWYEGRYGAYKMVSGALASSLEYLQDIGAVFKSEDHNGA